MKVRTFMTATPFCCLRSDSLQRVAELSTVCTAGELMITSLVVCRPEDSIKGCEQLMQHHQLRRIPVVDDADRCIGIVSQADIALHDSSDRTSETVAAISRPLGTRHHHQAEGSMTVAAH